MPRRSAGPGRPNLFGIALVLVSLVGAMVRFLPGGGFGLPAWSTLQGPVFNTAVALVGAGADSSLLVGMSDVALTPLHPAGAARFDGDRLDVVTSGEFLDAGVPVRIIEARGSRIVVQKA